MTSIKYLVAACVLALSVGTAKAAMVQVFSLDGTVHLFDIGANIPPNLSSPFSGQMTLDTSTGIILELSLDGGLSSHITVPEYFFQNGSTFGYIQEVDPFGVVGSIVLHAAGTLVGFTGGDLTGDLFVRHSVTGDIVGTISGGGSIRPPSEVPLPAAFPLFLTALAALSCWGWRWRKAKPSG